MRSLLKRMMHGSLDRLKVTLQRRVCMSQNLIFPFFPDAALEETVYSVFCRIQARSGLHDKMIIGAFTDHINKAPVLAAIPGYLNRIASNVPNGHPWQDPGQIISHHTALPYFLYFDAPKVRKIWYEKAVTLNSRLLGLSLGFTMHQGQASCYQPRFCAKCAANQIESLGFSFFRRDHQLPSVYVCPDHGTVLSNGCRICGTYPIKRGGMFMPGQCRCLDGAKFLAAKPELPIDLEPFIWLAQQSAQMVGGHGTSCGDVNRVLKRICLEKSFALRGNINYQGLADAVQDRFGITFLEAIGYPVRINGHPAPWLCRLWIKNNRRILPVKYLLVIGTLFQSLVEFERAAKKALTSSMHLKREESPIPHRSNATGIDEKLTEKVIALAQANTRLRTIALKVGIKNSQVAFILEQNKIRLPLSPTKLKRIGAERLCQVRNALKSGVLKKTILERYGISKSTLDSIELDDPVLKVTHRHITNANRVAHHRKIVSRLLCKDPGLTRSLIKEKSFATYAYLKDHDRSWFDAHVPLKQSRYNLPRAALRDALDLQKAAEIKAIVQSYTNCQQKPLRITATGLLIKAGFLSRYNPRKGKFPLVTQALEESVESYEHFVERKIKWAIENYDKDQAISVNVLRRKIGVLAHVLRRYKQVVISHATQHKIAINGRSFFAQ
jgi:hypothetical protein